LPFEKVEIIDSFLKGFTMIAKDTVLNWMRTRIESGEYDNAASLAREFLDEHNIHNAADPDFACVIDAGFMLASEIAEKTDKKSF
jgi:hypothetical protein